jgi:two-component system NtrC family sensor kinase
MRNAETLLDLLYRPNGKESHKVVTAFNLSYEKIDTIYDSVLRSATDEVVIDLVGSIQVDDQRRLRPLEKQILQAMSLRDAAGADKIYSNEYSRARAEHQALLNKLGDRAALLAQVTIEDEPLQLQFIGAVIAMLVGLTLLAYGLAHHLTRSFTSPINSLKYIASAIAAGELKEKLSLARKDEFGDMAEALNLMVVNLQNMNRDLNDQIRKLRETKGALMDTQNQLALQEHLMQQEKMASLGRLVAGVAHELNNPISFVYSNAVLLRKSIADLRMLLYYYDSCEGLPAPIKEGAARVKEEIDYDYLVNDITQAIEDCHEGSSRVRDIVLNLKMFSRTNETKLQKTAVTETIESAVRMLGQYFKSDRVALHRDYAELPEIECFAGQLSQVWMNLLVNAAQAMDGRGEIWITALKEGDQVVVKVRDNGPGIPEDVLIRIFDPFFTTKSVGDGTGLGLSIVHGIIERHSGEINVESTVGVGTTFTVRLPIKTPVSAEKTETEKTEPEPEGVLV